MSRSRRDGIPGAIPREAELLSAPGHALAYRVGARTIEELRRKATAALGERFDVRAFHSKILQHGAIPMGLWRTVIDAWIAEARH